jgi:sugar O-acyltransferase (sialic acid O-acetyltransferase NeuD family)
LLQDAANSARRIAIFGGRGAGEIAAVTIQRLVQCGVAIQCLGFLNDVEHVDSSLLGYPVLGPFAFWPTLPSDTTFLAQLHKVKDMRNRAQIVRSLDVPAERWDSVIDPLAAVADDGKVGANVYVGPGASVMCGTCLGDHIALRAGSQVSHNCKLGNFVYVGMNAVVCGYGTVGEGAYIAPGATIRDGLNIGRYSTVGLGTVVLKDVPEGAIVAGNPAKIIGSTFEEELQVSDRSEAC